MGLYIYIYIEANLWCVWDLVKFKTINFDLRSGSLSSVCLQAKI